MMMMVIVIIIILISISLEDILNDFWYLGLFFMGLEINSLDILRRWLVRYLCKLVDSSLYY